MTLNVCPADTVHAPVERVWDLLMQPAGYGRFWEFTVERVEPEGPAMVGQKFVGWTKPLCRRWRLDGGKLRTGHNLKVGYLSQRGAAAWPAAPVAQLALPALTSSR